MTAEGVSSSSFSPASFSSMLVPPPADRQTETQWWSDRMLKPRVGWGVGHEGRRVHRGHAGYPRCESLSEPAAPLWPQLRQQRAPRQVRQRAARPDGAERQRVSKLSWVSDLKNCRGAWSLERAVPTTATVPARGTSSNRTVRSATSSSRSLSSPYMALLRFGF